ncbi:MAG: NADH-quinone oxidoreductase subunit L [Planctomycetota bacterium]|nr:NADH-quinone oxidoreductase subunit L [Planctomycetota bacterium]MCX8039002.1 NADH-quinone oxidoreductase subunit L [Planctomycetota bacterium]MDW8372747.1 NADH-quinone oxidoreductase subunit L [Planctomycetota bacterium]
MDAQLLWLIPALPLAAALVNGALALGTARDAYGAPRALVALLAVLGPALSFALTLALWPSAGGPLEGLPEVYRATYFTWFAGSGFALPFTLVLDQLSALMLLFVTGIGALIHLYSVGYMWADRGFARFMCYMNLFMAAMIVLVMGGSLPVTFLGWEGVGLCSYLLIGFWHERTAYADAARKAFVYNRVGDLGFLLGAFALLSVAGSLDYAAISQWCRSADAARLAEAGPLLSLAALAIFLGCCGKSAQIPLAAWLPDAMAGPTPVSALIHAATMVTAGVFLVARLADLYVVAPQALTVVLLVGCATALWGAIAGLVQHDIKKALAYSTVSQLGFMFMAAGSGAFSVALFHVFTHAFFKAALFLAAGAVIHGLHHEQDMRRMGGLRPHLPIAYLAAFYGWWAIVGLPFAAGFFSKDLILEHLWLGHNELGALNIAPLVAGVALLTAGLTAVYMTRVMTLVFWSPCRLDAEARAHIAPTPLTMSVPLLILALGSLVAGFAWVGLPLDALGIPPDALAFIKHYLAPVLAAPEQRWLAAHPHGELGNLPWAIAGVGTLVAALGALIGYAVWRQGPAQVPSAGSETAPSGWGGHWTFAWDRLAEWLIVKPVFALGYALYWVIELAILGISGWLAMQAARALGAGYLAVVQRARLRANLLCAVLGGAAFLAVVIVFVVR